MVEYESKTHQGNEDGVVDYNQLTSRDDYFANLGAKVSTLLQENPLAGVYMLDNLGEEAGNTGTLYALAAVSIYEKMSGESDNPLANLLVEYCLGKSGIEGAEKLYAPQSLEALTHGSAAQPAYHASGDQKKN